ncbi:hypothetical protein ACTJKO_00385 [Curtobacterium sp. 22159]|uniref:hypothetical protein n=1 Tax=Curtobacterium sp. 22159 TaxID=3453882 RepID=UPI003F85A82F
MKDFDTQRVVRCPIARECDCGFRHVAELSVPVLLHVVSRGGFGGCLSVDADGDVGSVPDERHRRRDAVVQVRRGFPHLPPDRDQRVVVETLHEHAGWRSAKPDQPNVPVQQIAMTLDRVDVVLDRRLGIWSR